MADPPQGGGGAQPAPPGGPAIGPALPGEQQPTVATVPSPPEAATRLFGDVRKGLDKSATGEFGVLQFAVCLVFVFVFCSWSVCLFCLGRIGLHWEWCRLRAFVCAKEEGKGKFVLVGAGSQEVQIIRSRVRGAERSAFSTALPRMRSDGHRHRRISPPQRTLFGILCRYNVDSSAVDYLPFVSDPRTTHISCTPAAGGSAAPSSDRPAISGADPLARDFYIVWLPFGCSNFFLSPS